MAVDVKDIRYNTARVNRTTWRARCCDGKEDVAMRCDDSVTVMLAMEFWPVNESS
jgi:hypothetical protein